MFGAFLFQTLVGARRQPKSGMAKKQSRGSRVLQRGEQERTTNNQAAASEIVRSRQKSKQVARNPGVRKPLYGRAAVLKQCAGQDAGTIAKKVKAMQREGCLKLEPSYPRNRNKAVGDGIWKPLPLQADPRNKRHNIVCCAADLGLKGEAEPSCIKAALTRLRNSRQSDAPRVVLVNQLSNFDDSCLAGLVEALRKQPGIFSINVGDEAAARITMAGWNVLVEHLESEAGARIVCQFLADERCPKAVRERVKALCGRTRRTATEEKARALLERGSKGAARKMVPWRCPDVHKALDECSYGDNNVKWGMPTWHPKVAWPELG